MESEEKNKSYEGTQYEIGSLNKDYFDLLKSIFDKITPDALKEVAIPPDKTSEDALWDGRFFWNFISNLQKDDKEEFIALLTENGVNFGNLSKTPYQGVTIENAEIGICTSAQIQRISLEKYIENYIVRCYRKEYDIKGFDGHDNTIKNILKIVI